MFVSFFGWFGLCLLLQAASYYQNYRFKDNEPRRQTLQRLTETRPEERVILFEDSLHVNNVSDVHLTTLIEEDDEDENGEDIVTGGTGLEEPLVSRRELYKKSTMDDSDMGYFYQTGEFAIVVIKRCQE